ncbi:hypothetical protein PRZ48_010286 [Zasmidium cellare]|uniref:Uncharacterized protein n=1 Tax=Zasmidium cellare TaxID=395010 RepID=A0ABR0E8P7_ZASCE|nr:hypothetical protein PRZ48_010286 [Zasmidium cellare]
MASTTPTTQTKSTQNNDNIQGLREQIIANATILFPHLTAMYTTFQVITTRENNTTRALLLYTDNRTTKIVAKGPASASSSDGSGDQAEQALRGLLDVTSEALGWYTTTLLGEVENSEEVAGGGELDLVMVETGFHFVAVERCMEVK